MKKIIAMLLTMICIIGLVGCGNTNEPPSNVPPETTQNTELPEVEESPEIEETPEIGVTTESKMKLTTKYYSIQLPEEWEPYCMYEILDEMHISVHELESYDTSFGGWLFSIELYGPEEEYEFLPSYKRLGKLSTDTGEYDMIVIYPTDVQFSQKTAEQYLAMSNQVEDILKTIEIKENAIFLAD